jgi:hypothetical protein
MNYRLATLLDRESHTSDITKIIDLTLVDKVSQIQIVHEPTNGASGTPTAHPARCVTKIELVDGSDVIFSLSGVEAQAVDFYHHKRLALNHVIFLPTMNSEMVFNLNFGRFLYDPLLAFDPSKFRNPQLKITLDINAGGVNVAGGYLSAFAHIFDEKSVDPVGFLMHKEIKDYALAASAHEYTDLPVDFAYRKLFARIQKYGTGADYCFDTVKLSEDNDKRIPLNHTINQILKTLVGQSPQVQEWILVEGSEVSKNGYCTMTYWPTFQATMWEAVASAWGVAVLEGDGGRFKVDMATAHGNTQLHGLGWCPHGVIEIPFGRQDELEDWYDVTKVKNLRLDIKAASGMSSSESCQVFMQQLRKYAAA